MVEDHWPEGGLGDAVSEVFAGRAAPVIVRLAVRALPGSGTPQELLDRAGIGADAIVDAVKHVLGELTPRGAPASASS